MRRFEINVEAVEPGYEQLISITSRAAEETLAVDGSQESTSINILLTGDRQLRELNRKYRGIDIPTDVLSFPFDEAVEGLEKHLGDIAISLDRVRQQAQEAGHSLESELQLLVIHGVLHLLGYDHHEVEIKQRMWSRQEEILRSINAEILNPDEEQND